MAQPAPYDRQFGFSGQPRATWAEGLENELNAVKVTSDETLTNLELIQRDDGALRNGIVTRDSLAPDLAVRGLVELKIASDAEMIAGTAGKLADAAKVKANAERADFTPAGVNAVVRPLRDKLRDFPAAVIDFTNITAALAANAGRRVVFPPGTYSVTASATWPAGVVYAFAPGAQISVASGQTLTIRGVVEAAPSAQIFAGAGSVVGVKDVHVEWFGAVGDGSTNDQPEIQAAHDCIKQSSASDGEEYHLRFRAGANYGLGATLVIAPTLIYALRVSGAGGTLGTRLTALATFSGTAAVHLRGDTDATQGIASYVIGGFSLVAASGTSATTGFLIGGSATRTLIGTQMNLIEDVYVEGFAINWDISDCRLIRFRRCSGWAEAVSSPTNLRIRNTATTSFTGDLEFDGCQWVNPEDGGVPVVIVNAQNGSQLKGIRFSNCVIYRGALGMYIEASAGGIIGDIWWLPGCQIDGFMPRFLLANSTGAGSLIDGLHFNGGYYRGCDGTTLAAVEFVAASSGTMYSVSFNGNEMKNVNSARPVIFNGVQLFSCNGNKFLEVQTVNELITIASSDKGIANENALHNVTAITVNYMFSVSAGCDYIAINDNLTGGHDVAGVILNLSVEPNLSFNNNL